MWIRSQSKWHLVDVKGCYIFARWPYRGDKQDCGYRIVGLINEPSIEGCSWTLGDYKTEEKAMSVLDELQNRIIKAENDVFQMPEDE